MIMNMTIYSYVSVSAGFEGVGKFAVGSFLGEWGVKWGGPCVHEVGLDHGS